MKKFCLAALMLVLGLGTVACEQGKEGGPVAWSAETRPYLDHATKVANYLVSVSEANGLTPEVAFSPGGTRSWVPDGAEAGAGLDLAEGQAGITLFLLELYRVTQDEAHRAQAVYAANSLLASCEEDLKAEEPTLGAGLYDGIAGIGFVLHRASEVLGESRFREAAASCAQAIEDRLTSRAGMATWGTGNGLYSGDAGSGLYLLYAAKKMGRREALEPLREVGNRYLEIGRLDWKSGALYWTVSDRDGMIFPNFSRGNAGIGYFLIDLYKHTEDDQYLSLASAGAEYLKAIAQAKRGESFLLPYGMSKREWRNRYELGWADGIIGSSRFFYHLAYTTGDPQWTEILDQCIASVSSSEPDSTWSLRDGKGSVAQFWIQLYQNLNDQKYMDLAQPMLEALVGEAKISEATASPTQMSWSVPDTENPELATTPLGYLNGAAGMGLLMLQMDAALQSHKWPLVLPDDPFGPFEEF